MLPEYLPPPPSFLQQLLSIPPEQLLNSPPPPIPEEELTHKECFSCKNTKSVSQFYWVKATNSWSSYCRDCQKGRMKHYNEKRSQHRKEVRDATHND